MSKIKQLSTEDINQIAAGEVIERPASVVKELIENAIDAESEKIAVRLLNYGKDLIEVQDDGTGMALADIGNAIKRHATSKIQKFKDVFSVKTLGFRGEALPSIASISKFEIESRERNSNEGVHAVIENEKITSYNPKGMPSGTLMRVADIFYNTPVRKKFLKADRTELSAITDLINKIALVNPNIGFSLSHNQKTIFSYSKTKTLRERMLDIFSKSIVKNTAEALYEDEEMFLKVVIGAPSISKSTVSGVFTFVNGRPIRDKAVHHAITQAYDTFLMHGRYPFIVLSLQINPALVDVNVHPTKSEIKFVNPKKIHDIVFQVVRKKLSTQFWYDQEIPFIRPRTPIQAAVKEEVQTSWDFQNTVQPSAQKDEAEVEIETKTSGGFFSTLRVIGQYHAQYIVCEKDEILYLIDHHAAHERVLFEKLVKSFHENKIESQNLLVPIILEVDKSKIEVLNNMNKAFSELGIEYEHFGESSFVVKRVPSIIPEAKIKTFIDDILDRALHINSMLDKNDSIEHALTPAINEIFSLIACHSAIRGTKFLNTEEMRSLLQQLDSIDINSNCPHGRPIFIEFHINEVEKRFGRIV